MKFRVLSIVFAFLLLVSIVSALTVGVINRNNYSVFINVTVSESLKPYVEIIDTTFTLAPGERKDAQFEVTVYEPGTYEGEINVWFLPPVGNGFGAISKLMILASGEGVERPIEQNVTDNVYQQPSPITGGVSVGGGQTNEFPEESGDFNTFALVAILLAAVIVIGFLVYLIRR